MTARPPDADQPRGMNRRVIAMVVGLLILIAASVILTDWLSPRIRAPGVNATAPSRANVSTSTGAAP